MSAVWPVAATFVLSWLLTGLVRRLALRWRVIDVPNRRSSHTVPTPRGGGLAIVVAFLAGIGWVGWQGRVDGSELVALGGAGGLVAAIGFIDDRHQMAAGWRLLAHFVAAGWLIMWLRLPPALGPAAGFSRWVLAALAAVAIVWLLNLYNFMDGIDGIAGIEAVTACFGAVVVMTLTGDAGWSRIVPAQLLAAVAGFLAWNLPPATIFMGDAGSGFLGVVLGAFALRAAASSPPLGWVWMILLAVFIVDASVTLARRALRGDRLAEAHRSHAYQHAYRRFGARRIVMTVALVNIVWLLPIAVSVGARTLSGPVAFLIAVAPLAWLAYWFGSGRPEPQA